MPGGQRPPLREQLALFHATIAAEGVTTGAGAGAGNSIIDAALIGAGATSFVGMLVVLYPGQLLLVESMSATAFNNATGEVTLSEAYKGVAAAIPAGIRYMIITLRSTPAAVAALQADVTALMADVGNPTGEALGNIADKWGDIARSLDLILGARWDGAGDLGTDIVAILAALSALAVGKAQEAATTIDLNQGVASYDLFTGTDQVVILESLSIKMPTGAAGGALTSISIQTDDATPGVIIDATNGAVANLTSEADLSWTGALYITVGTKIQLTIGGGAHGAGYVCNVTAKCRAIVLGGYLA